MLPDNLSRKHKKIVRTLIKEAKKSEHSYRLAAALVGGGGRILKLSKNVATFSKFASRFHMVPNYASLHAEIACLIGLDPEKLQGSDIYVIRIAKDESLTMSRPCFMCEAAMKYSGISRCFYTDKDGHLVKWDLSNDKEELC